VASLKARLEKLEVKYKLKTQLVFLINPKPSVTKKKKEHEIMVVMKI